MGVAAGLDVGIDANGGRSGTVEAGGFADEDIEFGGRFDVEEEDFFAEGFANFFTGFADAGEDDALTGNSGVAEAVELAATDDIETGAEAGEEFENFEIGVGLDRVADGGGKAAKGVSVFAVGGGDGGLRVNVSGSGAARGNLG